MGEEIIETRQPKLGTAVLFGEIGMNGKNNCTGCTFVHLCWRSCISNAFAGHDDRTLKQLTCAEISGCKFESFGRINSTQQKKNRNKNTGNGNKTITSTKILKNYILPNYNLQLQL